MNSIWVGESSPPFSVGIIPPPRHPLLWISSCYEYPVSYFPEVVVFAEGKQHASMQSFGHAFFFARRTLERSTKQKCVGDVHEKDLRQAKNARS